MSNLPLEGIRILNFGTAAAAPLGASILSFYGAENIKVESRTRPDPIRLQRPFIQGLPIEESIDVASFFCELNQTAKSVQVNLKSPEGIELVKKLVKISDVVLDNFNTRVMKSLGLNYEELKKIKPDIIQVSASAVGQFGPLSHMAAYAPTIGAISGIDSMLGYPDGRKAIDQFAGDYLSATCVAIMILGAVQYRNKTGKGQFIDLGEIEPVMYTMGEPVMDYGMNNRLPKPNGNRREGFCPCGDYPSKGFDRWVSIAVKTEDEWQALCNVMGNPDWTKQDKFADRAKRVNNQDELDKLIGEWTKTMTPDEAMYLLQEGGVAGMVVLGDLEVLVDPQHLARETVGKMDLPGGRLKGLPMITPPLRFSESSHRVSPAPAMGEHNDYVYGELLCLSKDKIEELKKSNVII